MPRTPPPPVELPEDAPIGRILMVDDHPPNLVALSAILQPLGQELVRANSGREALRQLLEGDFALILMDVQMPGLDGLETARLIKERPRNRHIPIIFLTAIAKDPSYIFRGYREGAVDDMLKPFDPEILRAKAAVFVDLWRKGELVRRQQELLLARERVEQERRVELRFRAVTDSMPQCVWAARADGEIHYCNRVWREYAGEETGITFFDAVPEEEAADVRAAFIKAVRAGLPLEREQRLRRHDGEWLWHLVRMLPETDETGQITGFICTATDIDQQKRFEEANRQLLAAAQEAREQAEIASRAKDEFLAVVSHELRTPLNAILGWTQMLRTGVVEERARPRALETIERNARAQTQLVEDILDVSRIVVGKLRVNIQKIDLNAVARAALDAVRPAAEAKGVELVCTLCSEVAEFYGDPDRLQQIIWNLLVNAIKFTPRDGRVTLSVARVESQMEIRVVDTGVGITPEFLPHVFDRFRQADSSITREQGGLGLGLAIVRHLVELHGGTVEARSEGPGRGAELTVRLPVRAVAMPSTPAPRRPGELGLPEAEPLDPNLLAGVDVLVVDDEPDARELLTAVLGRSGARVRTAGSSDEAIALLREQPPHVVLSDIGLPREDGYVLLRRLRELAPSVPAAALTAFAGADDYRRALEAGFQAHLGKPIEPDVLRLLVASLVRRSEVARVEPQAAAG
jgi:PAS domain S-box-containing protein